MRSRNWCFSSCHFDVYHRCPGKSRLLVGFALFRWIRRGRSWFEVSLEVKAKLWRAFTYSFCLHIFSQTRKAFVSLERSLQPSGIPMALASLWAYQPLLGVSSRLVVKWLPGSLEKCDKTIQRSMFELKKYFLGIRQSISADLHRTSSICWEIWWFVFTSMYDRKSYFGRDRISNNKT